MSKKKEFHFTFGVFLRLLIFFLIIYFSINYFVSQKDNSFSSTIDSTLAIDEETKNNLFPQFLGNIYSKLPEDSRYQIEHLNQNPTVVYLQNQLDGFPQKQIKELQKMIVKNVSDNIIKNIDQN
ncbi:hypothetical protein SDC9_108224 [bioreactor metagenome]|uniref:Uncharacterized protein n=1 Tax=bioreactor metagenome TaxID=1076179 RepID=A0A645B8I0_9ZZZZ